MFALGIGERDLRDLPSLHSDNRGPSVRSAVGAVSSSDQTTPLVAVRGWYAENAPQRLQELQVPERWSSPEVLGAEQT